jgi:hypothetical protein
MYCRTSFREWQSIQAFVPAMLSKRSNGEDAEDKPRDKERANVVGGHFQSNRKMNGNLIFTWPIGTWLENNWKKCIRHDSNTTATRQQQRQRQNGLTRGDG